MNNEVYVEVFATFATFDGVWKMNIWQTPPRERTPLYRLRVRVPDELLHHEEQLPPCIEGELSLAHAHPAR